MWDQSLWQLLIRGGPVMWPLLASSIIGLALILDRLVSFAWHHERFSRFIRRLEPVVRAERWEEAARICSGRGPFSHVAKAYLEQRSAPRDVRENVVQREGQIAIHRLERRLRWLAITGSLSPMLGLLGTVTGLVSAFHQIEILGGQIQPSDLAAGIWEALLTTVFGLVVGLGVADDAALLEALVRDDLGAVDLFAALIDDARRHRRRQPEAAGVLDQRADVPEHEGLRHLDLVPLERRRHFRDAHEELVVLALQAADVFLELVELFVLLDHVWL